MGLTVIRGLDRTTHHARRAPEPNATPHADPPATAGDRKAGRQNTVVGGDEKINLSLFLVLRIKKAGRGFGGLGQPRH